MVINIDDEELLCKLKNEESKAFEVLYKKYYKILNYEAFYILKDEMEAQDQVHALFHEFLDKKLYLRINSALKTYMHTSIRNRCFNVLTKKKGDQKRLEVYTYTINDTVENDLTERNELKIQFNTFLNQLPPQRSQAFHLIHIEERRYKEAADEMGISINSVKTHLKLAVKALRSRFIDFK